MKKFRLAYPAHIYVTVEAETLADAKRVFAGDLEQVSAGVTIDLNLESAVVYPNANHDGEISARKVLLEDTFD